MSRTRHHGHQESKRHSMARLKATVCNPNRQEKRRLMHEMREEEYESTVRWITSGHAVVAQSIFRRRSGLKLHTRILREIKRFAYKKTRRSAKIYEARAFAVSIVESMFPMGMIRRAIRVGPKTDQWRIVVVSNVSTDDITAFILS